MKVGRGTEYVTLDTDGQHLGRGMARPEVGSRKPSEISLSGIAAFSSFATSTWISGVGLRVDDLRLIVQGLQATQLVQ